MICLATLAQRIAGLAHSPSKLVIATLLATLGLWWMLPSSGTRRRMLGVVLLLAAAVLAITTVPRLGGAIMLSFWSLAGVTLASAVAAITAKNPIYSAIWFAVTLLGTGGLLLIHGAQFLGVATVAVYAGAIVVTFLFVLMLAQPEGHAYYDRISWGPLPTLASILAAMTLTATIIWLVGQIPADFGPPTSGDRVAAVDGTSNPTLTEHHVAALGGVLFTRYLIAVQAAAAVLMAALVGAVAIASRGDALASEAEPLFRLAGDAPEGSHRV